MDIKKLKEKIAQSFTKPPKKITIIFGVLFAIIVVAGIFVSLVGHHSDKKPFPRLNDAFVGQKTLDVSKKSAVKPQKKQSNELIKAVFDNQKAIAELSVQMHMLNRHLGTLEREIKDNPHNNASILAIKEQVTQSLKQAAHFNAQHIQEINESIDALSIGIQKALKAKKDQDIKRLDPKALPFLVVDAEWWNGAHKIRIKDKKSGEYNLIDVGTNYQGWVLSKVSGQAPTTFTFVNQKGQRVEVVR